MNKLNTLFLYGITLTMLILPNFSIAEIAVVVGSNSAITTTDLNELKRVYSGKSKSLGGVTVSPINQKEGAITDTFNREVLNKSSTQVKAYWSKLIFTGKGTPPKEVSGDAEVIAAVSSEATAVGYIDSSSVTDSVKVILSF